MIELHNLCKTYHHGGKRIEVFRDLSLRIDRGEHICLTGASGAGKSTLLQLLGCLDQPDRGQYSIDGEDMARLNEEQLAQVRNQKIGFVFQSSHFVDYLTVAENVALPGLYGQEYPGEPNTVRALDLLRRVGLEDRADHLPSALSGGERQRAAIARALMNRPTLLLADEPTGNLDPDNTQQVIDLIGSLRQQGVTVILVTHDTDVASFGDRRINLIAGQLEEVRRAA